jgi:predicted Zn-dependent peptidase
VNLPANKVELWARIESDRMANAVFREFFTERDVVLEERRQRVDADPDGRLYEAFMATAFTAHPYRRPIIGWASDIEYLGMKDVERFYRLMHAPNNTVITIVGQIDTKKTLEWIKTYFGGLPRQPDPPRPTTREPRASGEKRVLVKVDANPRMIIGFHKPALPSADDYVFDVLEAVLSSDRTSRFYRILVEEKGLAESVQAVNGLPGSRYDNLFAIFASPRQPHGNQELEAALEELLEQLKTQPVPQRELQKIKNQVQAHFIRQQRSNQGLASLLSFHQCLFGSCRHLFDYVDKINAVTADDIMRVARNYLIRQNRTVAWGVKE